jgi:hypothetical protein
MKRMILARKMSCVSTCPDVKGDGIGTDDTEETVEQDGDDDRKRKDRKNCSFRFSDRVIQFGVSADLNGDGIPDCCRSDKDHADNRKRDGGRRPCNPNDAEFIRLLAAKGLTACPVTRCNDGEVKQTDPTTLVTSCVLRSALCSQPTPPIHCNFDDDETDDNNGGDDDDDSDDLHDCCDDDKRKRDGATSEKCRLAGVICGCDDDRISVNGVCVEFDDCKECNSLKTIVCGIQANRCDDK